MFYERHPVAFAAIVGLAVAILTSWVTVFSVRHYREQVSIEELNSAKEQLWYKYRITAGPEQPKGLRGQKVALSTSIQQAIAVAGSDSASTADRIAATQLIQLRSEQIESQALITPPQERIVGGVKVTDPADLPFLVAIVETAADNPRIGLHCGGVLIDPNWVITAAHCFTPSTSSQAFEVYVGSHQLSSGGHLVPIAVNGIKRNEYDPSTHEKDIALIKLATPVSGTPLIPLATQDDETKLISPRMRIAGWGVTNDGNISDDLLSAFVDGVDHTTCDKDYKSPLLSPEFRTGIENDMTCAGNGTADSCQGDSGGPLIIKTQDGVNRLEGLASWGEGCASPKFPGVYTRLPSYASWVTSTIQGR